MQFYRPSFSGPKVGFLSVAAWHEIQRYKIPQIISSILWNPKHLIHLGAKASIKLILRPKFTQKSLRFEGIIFVQNKDFHPLHIEVDKIKTNPGTQIALLYSNALKFCEKLK